MKSDVWPFDINGLIMYLKYYAIVSFKINWLIYVHFNELYQFVDTMKVIYLIGRSDNPNIGLGKTIEVPYVGQAFDISEI